MAYLLKDKKKLKKQSERLLHIVQDHYDSLPNKDSFMAKMIRQEIINAGVEIV